MTYQVLARKWRPRSFDTLVGQEHVVRALTHALNEQRLHHAYLFTGTRGVGKTTIARILAKALNCEAGITAVPCGKCGACQEIDTGRFIDLIEVDAATNTRVDEMRQLLDNAAYAPTRGRFKVYVIDEVHMLSNSAFNAMLKTLEEPPEHIKFILATTDPQKIPVTVLSRCLQFNLKQMPQGPIVDHLARILDAERVSYERPALTHIAKAAAGSMRDALSLLDQAIAHGAGRIEEAGVCDMLGTVGDEYLDSILDALISKNASEMIGVAAQMDQRSLSFDSALQELSSRFHRIALMQFAPEAIVDIVERERLGSLADRFDAEFLQLCYQITINGRNDLALAPDEYSGFLMTLLRLLAFNPETPGPLSTSLPGASSPELSTKQRGVTSASTGRIPQETTEPQPTLESNGILEDWYRLVEELRLGGMVRELAYHCEWVSRKDGRITLRLAPEHKSLMINKTAQNKLQEALAAHFGGGLKLTIETGGLSGETPAQRDRLARNEKQSRAVEAIEQDAFVQDVIETFDATINAQSINPLN